MHREYLATLRAAGETAPHADFIMKRDETPEEYVERREEGWVVK